VTPDFRWGLRYKTELFVSCTYSLPFSVPQLYELSSGTLLCSFLFDFGLTAVTMDLAEYRLFVGGSTGRIAQVNLFLQVNSTGKLCAAYRVHNSLYGQGVEINLADWQICKCTVKMKLHQSALCNVAV